MKILKTFEKWGNDNKPWYKNTLLNKETLNELLEGAFSDFNPDDNGIYRSLSLPSHQINLVETTSERKSAYTSNFYTMLINNLPSWSEFPKRQHIGSNVPFNFNDANIFRVIPKNGAKIGVCPGEDIQNKIDENTKLGAELKNDKITHINQLNILFDNMKIPQNVDWDEFIKNIQFINNNVYDDEIFSKYSDIKELDRLINPALGFEVYDYKDYATTELKPPVNNEYIYDDNSSQHEVWLDTDIILVPLHYFD